MDYSDLAFVTVNTLVARGLQFFTVGYGHSAQVINYGRPDEYWIDSRTDGGVQEREPEKDLHSAYIIRIPWDIELGSRKQIGLQYNWHGPIAILGHFRWSDPSRRFCDEMLLWASEYVGHPVCRSNRKDKVTPIVASDMFIAYTIGMTGKEPEVLSEF
jgi:hypothetical protein